MQTGSDYEKEEMKNSSMDLESKTKDKPCSNLKY